MAKTEHFIIEQGAIFEKIVLVVDDDTGDIIPIDGARFCCKTDYGGTVVFDYSSGSSQVVIDGPAGKVTIVLNGATTALLADGRHVFELVVNRASDSQPYRAIEGKLTVRQGVCV